MSTCRRIVFLLDQNVQHYPDITYILSNIHLSCLRILSFYASSIHSSDIKTTLMWGYKFYNSTEKEKSFQYKQCPFYEYSISSFDQFEKDLHEKFMSFPKKQSYSNKTIFPGEQLRTALTEILADYQWDRPELFSPTKKSNRQQQTLKKNQVFLFTSCPENARPFFENQSHNFSFIDVLLPKVLMDKFYKRLNICLCWIDVESKINSNKEVHEMLCNDLHKINGKLLQLNHISSWWLYCHGNQMKHNDMISSSSLLNTLLPSQQFEKKGKSLVFYNFRILGEDSNFQDNMAFISNKSNKLSALITNKCQLRHIQLKSMIHRDSIDINLLHAAYKPCFYMMQSKNADKMKKLMIENKAMLSELVIDAVILAAYIVPYTSKMGILLFTKSLLSCISYGHQKGEDYCGKEIAEVDQIFNKSKQTDLHTSFVNLIDPWFLANENLGFSTDSKKTLGKFYSKSHHDKKKQEENSKSIVEFIKKKLKKKKAEEEELKRSNLLLKKKNNMKGITWARWRLMEYEKKKQDKVDIAETNADINCERNNFAESQQNSDVFIQIEEDVIHDIIDFDNENKLIEWCKELCNGVVSNMIMCHQEVSTVIHTIKTFYSKNNIANNDSYKSQCIETVLSDIIVSVKTLKEKYTETQKEDLVKDHQLQVLLICCSVLHFTRLEAVDDRFLTKVVAVLRSLTFIENSLFVRNFLQTVILPRYAHKTPDFLRSIYDDLMINLPDVLDDVVEDTATQLCEESPIKSVQTMSSIGYCGSDLSSVGSYTNDRTLTFRRHSSIVGDNTNKKRIIVNAKTAAKKMSKKQDGYQSHQNGSHFNHPKPPVTPKSNRRRKSEPKRRCVPDTPESKQINDMIWKKQDRDRRHSLVSKKMKPIEESPLKDVTSPIKRRSLCRSNSFQNHTSPRRFYTMKRHPSMFAGSSKFADCSIVAAKAHSLKRHVSLNGFGKPDLYSSHTMDSHATMNNEILADSVFHSQTMDGSSFDSHTVNTELTRKSLERRASTLLLNFTEISNDCDETEPTLEDDPITIKEIGFEKMDSGLEISNFSNSFDRPDEVKKSCRKNIFSSRTSSSITSGTGSSFDSLSSSGSIKRKLLSSDNSFKKQCLSSIDANNPRNKNDEVFKFNLFGKNTSNEGITVNPKPKADVDKFVNANTVDWLSAIEKEQSEATSASVTFRNAFENLSRTPSSQMKCSPTVVKAGESSISVSPCISATSLQFLEKAPILSPDLMLGKRKSRRRRKLQSEA